MWLCKLDALRTRTNCSQVQRHPYTHVHARKHMRAHTHRRTHTPLSEYAHKCDDRCAHRPLSGYAHMHTRTHMRTQTYAHTQTHTHTCTRTCAHPIMTYCCFVHGSRDFPPVFCSWLSCFFTCFLNEALLVVGSILFGGRVGCTMTCFCLLKTYQSRVQTLFLAVDVWTHSNPLDTRTYTSII